MGFMDSLAALMSDTVTVVPGYNDWSGSFVESGSTFAPRCHIEGSERRVRDESGQEVTSTLQLYLDDFYGLRVQTHRFTLPSRYAHQTKIQAIAIDKESDEGGPLYEVIFLP